MINKILDFSNVFLKDINNFSDYKYRNIAQVETGNIVLIGMRRLGKTEYLKYRIKKSKLKPDEILFLDLDSPYFSFINFDKPDGKKQEFIDCLLKLLKFGKIKMVVIDEIQVMSNWSRVLKGFVDLFPKITFIATGSDAISLYNSIEHGVGRYSIKYMGPYTFSEYYKVYDDNLFNYLDNYSFPQGQDLDLNTKYLSIIEKQISISKIKKVNIDVVLRAISLNPGFTLTINKLTNIIKQTTSATSLNNKQINSILKWLEQSQLIIIIPDKYTLNRVNKIKKYTIYPYDWNFYKFYSTNKKYNDHPTKINNKLDDKNLPTQGFIFENMIISNVYSIFNDDLNKNRIFNKKTQPDVDLIIDDINYEIKSFDVFSLKIDEKIKILTKAESLKSKIIHLGISKIEDKIEFINANEFLLNLKHMKF